VHLLFEVEVHGREMRDGMENVCNDGFNRLDWGKGLSICLNEEIGVF